jgi:hypothetical protein
VARPPVDDAPPDLVGHRAHHLMLGRVRR